MLFGIELPTVLGELLRFSVEYESTTDDFFVLRDLTEYPDFTFNNAMNDTCVLPQFWDTA